jgi:transaldolase
MSNPLHSLAEQGQSIWYDNIQRDLLRDGTMAAMIADGEIRGVTSNPSIFNNAIANSDDYFEELSELAKAGKSAMEIYEALAIADIQAATDLFSELYAQTQGGDGYVSLEVSPLLADETEATIEEAKRLWARVDRPNLMVKIPATRAGIPAIAAAIEAGINVNVTLIFSITRYAEVMEAYIEGLERRAALGGPLDHVASVASFFISRIDSIIDGQLEALMSEEGQGAGAAAALRGSIAVANAKLAYQRFKTTFGTPRFDVLAGKQAAVQRPLWASTSTKNPNYSDVKYVEELIGPQTINTVPPKTLDAFREHGSAAFTLETEVSEAQSGLNTLAELGVDFAEAADELERAGVASFAKAFESLLATIETRRLEALA